MGSRLTEPADLSLKLQGALRTRLKSFLIQKSYTATVKRNSRIFQDDDEISTKFGVDF